MVVVGAVVAVAIVMGALAYAHARCMLPVAPIHAGVVASPPPTRARARSMAAARVPGASRRVCACCWPGALGRVPG
jgi:hypothetical protein